MKRIHYLLLGLLVSLTIAAVSPGLPPTRIIAGNSTVTIVTNGLNNFTLTASGGVGTSNGLATNLTVYSSGAAAPLIVNTNQLIVTNGNVGIGTVPIDKLHVAGNIQLNSTSKIFFSPLTANSDYIGSDGSNIDIIQSGAILARFQRVGATQLMKGLDVYDYSATANQSILIRQNSGGILSGLTPFVVDGASAVAYTLDTKNTLANGTAKLFALRNNTSEKVTVLASGNLGIGTNAPTERLHVFGNALIATNLTANDLSLSKTITAPATTGNQTINKAAGRVNIAAAGTTVTVTCSLATANSIIIAVAATDDATAMVTSVVPAAGSFTINTVATTAETAFNFLIVN